MSDLQAIHGRIVDLRRHVNVHLKDCRPFKPSERYELWIRLKDGCERKFTINTRTMPARRGHVVSLIVTSDKTPQVLGLANWTVLDGANYISTDPPSLLRPLDALVLLMFSVALMMVWGGIGAVLSVHAGIVYLMVAAILRANARIWRTAQVYRAIDLEAKRVNGSCKRLH